MIQEVNADDVPVPSLTDLSRLLSSPSVEGVARFLLGSSKAEGVLGKALREAITEATAPLAKTAPAALIAQIPEDIASVVLNEDGLLFPQFMWITDGRLFAMIHPDRAAFIGTAADFLGMFTGMVQRVSRRIAADPDAPADARYRAALLARPRLAVIG